MGRAEARPYCAARWFTTVWSWLIAPDRLVHAPTSVTALCSAVRATALDVSRVLRAAACWEAVTGPGGDEGADGDAGDGDGDEAAGAGVDAAGAGAGADRPDRATPDTTAAATTTTAPAASTGPRAGSRRAHGSGSGPPGAPAAAGACGPGSARRPG